MDHSRSVLEEIDHCVLLETAEGTNTWQSKDAEVRHRRLMRVVEKVEFGNLMMNANEGNRDVEWM